MKPLALIGAIVLLIPAQNAAAEIEDHSIATDDQAAIAELSPEQQEYIKWIQQMWDSLERRTGMIEIPDAKVTLNVPTSFYYLGPEDAERVLVEVWGNPPGQSTLGMLFPAEITPFDPKSWAVTVQYEEDGYVSDEDADDIQYNDLLKQLKAETKAASEQRVAQGYDSIALVGWAADPYYDKAANKLHWAKEFKFSDQALNTLNYNIRILGRKGVLVMNFVATIDQKPEIEANLDSVLAMADFDAGSTYGDFNPDIDTVAAYGLGALVAGKLAAKAGLIPLAIIFLKKFGIFIVIAIAAAFRAFTARKKSAKA